MLQHENFVTMTTMKTGSRHLLPFNCLIEFWLVLKEITVIFGEMPILIKDYSWRQTEDSVILRVSLKGISLKNVDIFTSDNYLKIHAPPFLFEVCLWSPIVEAESTCMIENCEAVFNLLKKTAQLWSSLTADLTRQETLEVKKKAIEEAQVRTQKRQEERKAKNDKKQKAAVREQINLQTQEQEVLKQNKEHEKTSALRQMGWSGGNSRSSSVTITELPSSPKKVSKEIFIVNDKDVTNSPAASIRCTNKKQLVPAPRQTAQISVSFTPREFPTPCRESKMAEEQEWLTKQAEARRRAGFVAEDLRPEEQDPVWLCEKAESFYNLGNYLGAISAYTHALTLNNRLYEVYAGRAKAQLAVGNLKRAITDSSEALELLTPPVALNAEARAQCLLCRGTALAKLGLETEALGELRAAEQLRPDCPDIKLAISQLDLIHE